MIKKITINGIASYKKETSLETDKIINLIYGLNGSGKTTLSNYLKSLNEENNTEFQNCSVDGFSKQNQKTLVYNQRFVEENFYESETQKGIFTLAKNNKEALENLNKAKKEKTELDKKLNDEKNGLNKQKQNKENEINKNSQTAQEKVWEIKTKYTGGDIIFDEAGFLDGLKKKANLFNHIRELTLQETTKNIEEIKKELQELGEGVEERKKIDKINLDCQTIEQDAIFQEAIIGNENSSVSSLINELKNSDWVKKGLDYVNLSDKENCPFCQQETLNEELVNNIKNYFDKTYETKTEALKKIKTEYENIKNGLSIDNYKRPFYTNEHSLELENLFKSLSNLLQGSLAKIQQKIDNPSQAIKLDSSSDEIKKINNFINTINKEIENFNQKLKNRKNTIQGLKTEFWKNQRKKYDQTITYYQEQDKKLQEGKSEIEQDIENTNQKIKEQESIIAENQKQITNIETTIDAINKHLLNFGIQDFKIVKNDEQTYKIQRGEETETKFKSLSEGEKTVISFLYFVELCKGLETREDTKNKIIVIDDPISSLSHMYVFNVAQLIKEVFTNSKQNNFSQIFVLTHSLYFFHELTRVKNTALFRITKTDRSQIEPMKVDEIQNEYESYWQIVKTGKKENKFLVANAMRNILEHFFGFIDKTKLNDVFKKDTFKSNEYQAFIRYINRESHSDIVNITDFKAFDLKIFKETFENIFKESGYQEHYNKFINGEKIQDDH